ncbi:MAG: hypothetical protein ACLRMN_16030 [Mediterraneibacter gnavus]
MKNEETKREKFVRIAEARTNKIINMIQLLGNCSNQSLYEYSQKDVNKIFNTIQTELDEAKRDIVSRIAKKEVNLHLINRMEGYSMFQWKENFQWIFSDLGSSDKVGVNESGIGIFKRQPYKGLAKEILQNVTDAKIRNFRMKYQ